MEIEQEQNVKEQKLLSNFTSEEIVELIENDKKIIRMMEKSPTFICNVIDKVSKSKNKELLNRTIDIVFNYNINNKKMNALYSIAMNKSNKKILNKLLERNLNIYERKNDSYIIFGFIARRRFDLLNILLNSEIDNNKDIRWNITNSANETLSKKIMLQIFINNAQNETLEKILSNKNIKDYLNIDEFEKMIFDSMEFLFKYNRPDSTFFDDRIKYFLKMPVLQKNKIGLIEQEDKEKIINDIYLKVLLKFSRFIINHKDNFNFTSNIVYKNTLENEDEIFSNCINLKTISLEEFEFINKIYDISDFLIKNKDVIKNVKLKEYLKILELVKREKNILDDSINVKKEDERFKKRL